MADPTGARALRAALTLAAEAIRRNRRLLDDLNVFPVPDGDTGTNLAATLDAGVRALDASEDLGALADRVRDALLRASRGNSGFILAWFFQGFLSEVARSGRWDGATIAAGFAQGSWQARAALAQPVEGTMITVLAAMADALGGPPAPSAAEALARAVAAGRTALAETPRQLPMLGAAGVVDAGAAGLLLVVEGMRSAWTGAEPPVEREEDHRVPPDPSALRTWKPPVEGRFCTEAVIEGPADPDDPTLRPFLTAHGTSVAIVADRRLLKVHVHTDDPEAVLARLARHGAFTSTKVEDMKAQIEATSARLAPAGGRVVGPPDATGGGPPGVLALIPGDGFEAVFRDLCGARCLCHGRDLPSPAAILDALAALDAPSVLLLPNHGNAIPAATLAAGLAGRPVAVVPTRNVVEGIAATYGYDEGEGLAENARAMSACTGLARCLGVYRSVRDAMLGDLAIPEGSYFATRGDDVLCVREDLSAATLAALEAAGLDGRGNVTIYTGEAHDDARTPELLAAIRAAWPSLAVDVRRGGQPRERLLLSLE